jgi:hypothetical protein
MPQVLRVTLTMLLSHISGVVIPFRSPPIDKNRRAKGPLNAAERFALCDMPSKEPRRASESSDKSQNVKMRIALASALLQSRPLSAEIEHAC